MERIYLYLWLLGYALRADSVCMIRLEVAHVSRLHVCVLGAASMNTRRLRYCRLLARFHAYSLRSCFQKWLHLLNSN